MLLELSLMLKVPRGKKTSQKHGNLVRKGCKVSHSATTEKLL